MKILVMAAGAVGGYYGSLLARAGNEVTFVARGDNLDVIRRHGTQGEQRELRQFHASRQRG